MSDPLFRADEMPPIWPRIRASVLRIALAACLVPLTPALCSAGCTRLAQAPLRQTLGFLSVAASIDDVPVSLLLDTGAESGLITEEAARRLGLQADPGRYTRVQGTGGAGAVLAHARIERLTIGAMTLAPLSLPVGPLPAIPRIDPPVAGLLGADALAGFEVELDGPGQRLALYAPGADCAPPWPHETISLSRAGNRLSVTARLDGRPIEALLDTGSLSVILDRAAAARWGVSAGALARDPGGISGGVDMREAAYHWHRFASLAIGSVLIQDPVVTVTGVSEATKLLLGASWFAPRRVWLSFATGRMFVARDIPPASPGSDGRIGR